MIPTISISQSRNKGGDYCRSPTLGSQSPSLNRSSGLRNWGKSTAKRSTNRLSDSESNPDLDCEAELCNGEHQGGIFPGNSCKSDGTVNTKQNMALSAVMLSGGGNIGLKKKPSQRTLSDSECEHTEGQGGVWAIENSQDNNLSRSWPGSTTPSKCSCDRKSQETVIINVGGQVFETFKSTLRRLRSCKLASEKSMRKYYREDKGDYFFDRDPYAFNIILNYLRYGDLHLPTNLCGPALMREFQFWGIDESDIER